MSELGRHECSCWPYRMGVALVKAHLPEDTEQGFRAKHAKHATPKKTTTREKPTDGRTPYQLAREFRFNRRELPFAEMVLYKLNARQLKRAGDGKLEPF